MELNFTPVRTSVNYGINTINIEKNAIFTQKIEKIAKNCLNFKNFETINADDIKITSSAGINTSNFLNEELKQEIEEKSNVKMNISITKNMQKTLLLNFNFDKNNDILIGSINLNIENCNNAKIIIRFNSEKNISYNNLMININCGDETNAKIIIFDNNIFGSDSLISIESNLQKNASLDLFLANFASKNSIYSYKSNILGENSTSNLESLYLGGESSIIDLNYTVNVFAPNSKTNIDVMGAISGTAKKHFKGTIDFKKGCKKSIGQENEFCMLLSNTAKSKALPMILCTEEDVNGKHSSAVGKVDEKQLFYCLTRGFTYEQALKILVKAKFNNILSNIFDEELRNEILNKIDGKI